MTTLGPLRDAPSREGGQLAPASDAGLRDQAARLRALVREAEREHGLASIEAAPSVQVHPPAARHAPVRPPASPPPSPRIMPARQAPVVAFASGKGGVGKTTIAVNTCIELARAGARVTLVDADLGTANADVLCGFTPTRRLDRAIVHHAATLDELAVDAPGGFRLVPGSVGVARAAELEHRERAQLVEGVLRLGRAGELVVVDCGAGMGPDVSAILAAADVGIVVATPDPTSITDAYAVIKGLVTRRGPAGARGLRLVVNMASGESEALRVHARVARVCERFLGYRLALLGWVPTDPRAGEAVRQRRPLSLARPKARSARAIRELAQRVREMAVSHAVR